MIIILQVLNQQQQTQGFNPKQQTQGLNPQQLTQAPHQQTQGSKPQYQTQVPKSKQEHYIDTRSFYVNPDKPLREPGLADVRIIAEAYNGQPFNRFYFCFLISM